MAVSMVGVNAGGLHDLQNVARNSRAVGNGNTAQGLLVGEVIGKDGN